MAPRTPPPARLRWTLADMNGDPFTELAQSVLTGEMGIATAEEAVVAPEYLETLTLPMVEACLDDARSATDEGDWRVGVTLLRLLVAALRAAPDSPELDGMRKSAYPLWVEVARRALIACPDKRLLTNADAAATDVVRWEREAGSAAGEAAAQFALGTLYLDPYTVGLRLGPGVSHDPDHIAWLLEQRARGQLGDESLTVSQEEWQMPSPIEALRTADLHFEAAATAQGELLARILKARAHVLAAQAAFGQDVSDAAVTDMARRGLEAAPSDDPQLRLALVRFLQVYGIAPNADDLADLPDPAALELRYGLAGAVEVVRELVDLLSAAGEIERCMAQLERVQALISRAPDPDRAWALDKRLALEIARVGVEEVGAGDDLREAGRAVLADYEQGTVGIEEVVCTFLAIARAAQRQDLELRGLDTLRMALKLDPGLWERFPDEINRLQAVLQRGIATGLARSGKWNEALSAYIACVMSEAGLGLYESAEDALAAVGHVLQHPGVVPERDALAALGTVVGQLELHAGDDAVATIQEVWTAGLDAHVSGSGWTDTGMLSYLIQMSKGLRFAMSLTADTPDAVDNDQTDRELLVRIAALEAEVTGEDEEESPPGSIDEEALLTAYARPQAPAEGTTTKVRLSNLRQRYDARLAARLLKHTLPVEETLLSLEDLQAMLDERTVLLITHIGSADGHHALRHLLLTRTTMDAQVVRMTDVGAGAMAVKEGSGPWLRLSPEAFLVQDVRRSVIQEPLGDEPVVPEADEPLRRLYERFGDQVIARLEDLRMQGKDHLCFAGHGPLHYAPLHLAGPPGEPLADRWIVSYLPNLGLLRPAPTPPDRRAETIAALGLSYEKDARGLEPIPAATEEAELIAARFGASILPESHVTERAVRDALTNARYVHLSAHGRHDPAAPAFQCVFVTPGDGGDGRLFAHEVLGLDLRGLELLTLGACETALGRLDAADNLRGLPAAFLLAGVRQMIGTLWPVNSDASKHFFSEFYGDIAAERGVLDAFRTAQDSTRSKFPAYRDWGAFYLIAAQSVRHEEVEP